MSKACEYPCWMVCWVTIKHQGKSKQLINEKMKGVDANIFGMSNLGLHTNLPIKTHFVSKIKNVLTSFRILWSH
jgi:hypothetical protein